MTLENYEDTHNIARGLRAAKVLSHCWETDADVKVPTLNSLPGVQALVLRSFPLLRPIIASTTLTTPTTITGVAGRCKLTLKLGIHILFLSSLDVDASHVPRLGTFAPTTSTVATAVVAGARSNVVEIGFGSGRLFLQRIVLSKVDPVKATSLPSDSDFRFVLKDSNTLLSSLKLHPVKPSTTSSTESSGSRSTSSNRVHKAILSLQNNIRMSEEARQNYILPKNRKTPFTQATTAPELANLTISPANLSNVDEDATSVRQELPSTCLFRDPNGHGYEASECDADNDGGGQTFSIYSMKINVAYQIMLMKLHSLEEAELNKWGE
eukprot:scaffold23804_cov48-Cyclotella_meneghiniana.AAC.1